MESNTTSTSSGSDEMHVINMKGQSPLDEIFNLQGKTCTHSSLPDMAVCGHPAWAVWSWRPAAYDGYRCVCCIRKQCEETLMNVNKTLAELPTECLPRA